MNIKRYDIVQVDLSGAIGSEQGKVRPCVVVQNDTGNYFAPTIIVMPMTHIIKNLHMPTHTLIKKTKENGLCEDSMVLGEQLRTVDKKRVKTKMGCIDNSNIQKSIKSVYLASFGD